MMTTMKTLGNDKDITVMKIFFNEDNRMMKHLT